MTIVKSMTIDCEGTLGSILASATNGITIDGQDNTNELGTAVVVRLRNIAINGAGLPISSGLIGIRFLGGAALHVENVKIFGFTQKGIEFTPTNDATIFVKNTTIEDNRNAANNGGGGVLIKAAAGINATAVLDNVRLERNLFGLRADNRSQVSITNSVAAGNINEGIHTVAANSTIRVGNTVIAGNGVGILASNGAIISFQNNYVAGNTVDGAPTATVAPM